MSGNYSYIDSTPIDDESPYMLDWDNVDLGFAKDPEPIEMQTAGGTYTVYPLESNVGTRTGKVTLFAQCTDIHDKRRVLSEISALMRGRRKVHIGSRYLNVVFAGAAEVQNESRAASVLVGAEANFRAPDPYWYLNQPLKGIDNPVNLGDEWSLYDDNALPTPLPEYTFDSPTLVLDNWGNAPTFAAGAIVDGPADTTVYLNGSQAVRLAVALDGSGNGTFSALSEFRLDAGQNSITVENEDGTVITPGANFSISFGDTYMRFY